jgi:hypothetical protein
MNFPSPFRKPPRSIDDLFEAGKVHADRELRTRGHVHPAFLLLAANGQSGACFFQNGGLNAREKETFARICRTVAFAANAVASVLVLEIWMSAEMVPPGVDVSDYRPTVMPSQNPERTEAIALVGETRGRAAARCLPIVRYDNRKFHALGDPLPGFDTGDGWHVGGIFSPILPPYEVPDEMRQFARATLDRFGIDFQRILFT